MTLDELRQRKQEVLDALMDHWRAEGGAEARIWQETALREVYSRVWDTRLEQIVNGSTLCAGTRSIRIHEYLVQQGWIV